MKKCIPLLLVLFSLLHAQNFSEYRMRYDSFEENDGRALPYINEYIKSAKSAYNDKELFQAYKDAVYFSPQAKLAYSDSAITAAVKTGQGDLIATAHLTKGTVLYFNYRKFQPALDEYLKAWQFSKDSDNEYLHYKNLYHIAVIKSYLGYHTEALEIFEKCVVYFKEPVVEPEPPNVKFNRKKGYLNSLHQVANCLIEEGRASEAESLIATGLNESGAQADFYFERSCFYKLRGITAYRMGLTTVALSAFQTALPGFLRKNDFTNASVIYWYMGQCQLPGDEEKAVRNFARIDSIFAKYSFLLPEVRGSYEYMIDYYQKKNNHDLEHYYTVQLLKADRVLSGDFKYLSGKINREYDTADLLATKARLEHSVSWLYTVLWTVALLTGISGTILLLPGKNHKWFLGNLRKKKNIAETGADLSQNQRKPAEHATKVPDLTATAVLKKLMVLEQNNFFLESGMTLQKLAPLVDTNTTYLSIIIKDYKGCPYNLYIKELRIQYAAQMLREHKSWRSLTIEHLAKSCGFRDRNNFSDAFYEYHKIKPLEFIKKIKLEQYDV